MGEIITQSKLKSIVGYNKSSGVLFWKKRLRNRVSVNERVGSITKNGYLETQMLGIRYYVHRLVWLYVYGEQPKYHIDHINHNKTDNRIENLRCVKQEENNRNLLISKRNKSGTVGVIFDIHIKKWVAYICVNSKNKHIGSFLKKNDAIKARKLSEIKYGYHKNHGISSKTCGYVQ